MSTDFTLEFRKNHVHVQLAPDYQITPEGMARHWKALIDFCNEHNCRRVLSEGTNPRRTMQTIHAYDSGVSASVGGMGLKVACSWVGYVPDELTKFFQTVAANRGVQVQYFPSRAEALQWLGVDVDE